MSIESSHTWRSLIESSPESAKFLANFLIVAAEVMGEDEDERVVAQSVVRAFYKHGVVGSEIGRLIDYAEGDVERAYDVLTEPAEREKFLAEKPAS